MTAVAIDGPAGAGKSTVARAVAEKLGFPYIDTGAMYRAVALHVLEQGLDPGDSARASEAATAVEISIRAGKVYLDDRDVTDLIRTPDVTRVSAQIARHESVRDALVSMQRLMAEAGDVVMEGRDIGTRVLPDASVKVFLTASLDERARRRSFDEVGDEGDLESVRSAIEARDESDMSRAASPLAKAPDAVLLDSTGKSIGEVVDEVVELVRRAS